MEKIKSYIYRRQFHCKCSRNGYLHLLENSVVGETVTLTTTGDTYSNSRWTRELCTVNGIVGGGVSTKIWENRQAGSTVWMETTRFSVDCGDEEIHWMDETCTRTNSVAFTISHCIWFSADGATWCTPLSCRAVSFSTSTNWWVCSAWMHQLNKLNKTYTQHHTHTPTHYSYPFPVFIRFMCHTHNSPPSSSSQ